MILLYCFCCNSNNLPYGSTAELGTGNAVLAECVVISDSVQIVGDQPFASFEVTGSGERDDYDPNLAAINSRLGYDGLLCPCETGSTCALAGNST